MLTVGSGARFATIQEALAAAREGDTVEVLGGEYREQVRLKSGVTLRSQVPREAILRAAPVGGGPAVLAEGVKNARVTGFRILADAQMPLSAGIVLANSDVEVEDMEVAGAAIGVEIRGAASPLLRANAIHDCAGEGILISGASAPWLSHNAIQRNGRAGRGGARWRAAGAGRERVREERGGTAARRQHGCAAAEEFLSGRETAAAGGSKRMIAPAGRKLGKYEIRQKLGRGGMADVYLAQDTELGHTVALKLIEHSADADTRDSIEAERRGAELQAHLAAIDPRVVRIYDSGDLDGFFFVAMEYIDGQDLAELMRRGPLDVEFAADVAIAVAETLEHAHTLQVALDGKDFHGIVHGDIKPKNIRIDSHGEVRVLDFGIAKALSLSRRLTRNEFGSVPYASPERLDLGEVNALSDLWSLAVMLYEMVTGLQPYHADSTERLERMIRSRIPPPPAPDPCPEPLRRILMKAMAPAPETRYQSAGRVGVGPARVPRGRRPSPFRPKIWTRRGAHSADRCREETDETAPDTTPPGGAGRNRPRPRSNGRYSSAFSARRRGCWWWPAWSMASWLVVSEYFLWQHGQQLERDVETEQITDPDQIWAKWTELSKGNPSSLLLGGAREQVKQKFIAAADQVIATYRDNDSQPVYEKDWERARTMRRGPWL